MAYKTKYILPFENELNDLYEIYFDFIDFAGNPTQIFGAEDCMTLRSTTGDENIFEPILGTECLINIVVGKISVDGIEWENDQLQIFDLIAQHDNDIRVTIYRNQDYTKSVFQGFIVVEDNSQPFLDPPFTLSVRALDGLGLLKGIDFVDAQGNAFSGSMNPLEWIAQILYKTDQKLNIRSYFNIINISFPALPCIESFTINVNTFQTGQPQTSADPTIDLAASAADDCYTALEKIVRCLRCRLFQQDGVWNLVNLWEYQNPNGYTYYEYSISEPVAGIVSAARVGTKSKVKYDVQVSANDIMHLVKDDAVISLKLATKSEKLTYTYDQSLNKICNQNLSQGLEDSAHDGTISSTIQDPNINPAVTFTTQAYFPFCFDHFDNNDSVVGNQHMYPTIPPAKGAYIRAVKDSLSYELDRYLVLEKSTNQATFLRTSKFQIDASDVLQFSFDWRTRENLHTSSATFYVAAYIYLHGTDGTFWSLRSVSDGSIAGNPNVWLQTDSSFHLPGSGASAIIGGPEIFDTAANGYTNFSINAAGGNASVKAPVSGDIEIILTYESIIGATEVWFKNISLTIIPFLQGSYTALKGDFNYASSNNNVKLTDEQDVQISDSPKRYFKGALLQIDGKSLMPPTWLRNGISGSTKRFTQLMEELIYNAFYRQPNKIEGTMRGLTWVDETLTVRGAGLINSYFFRDHPEPTKKFMLTSFEIDYSTGFGRRVFVEILKDVNDTAQVEPDNYIFQYLFQ